MALAMLLGAGASAQSATVLVVLSSEAEPYQQAQSAIAQRMSDHQHRTITTTLSQWQKDAASNSQDKQAEVVIAVGTMAAVALHQHPNLNLPLFYCLVSSPQESGLLTGRTHEGVITNTPLPDQFKLMSQALPKTRHIGMLYRSSVPTSNLLVSQVKEALPPYWKLTAVDIDAQGSTAEAVNVLLKQDLDFIWTQPDGAIYQVATVRTLLLASMRRRIPVFGFSTEMVRAGSMVGVGVDPATQGYQIADLVVRHLRETPGQFPATHVIHPPVYKTAINLIVSRRLRIDIPVEFSNAADEVFNQEDR